MSEDAVTSPTAPTKAGRFEPVTEVLTVGINEIKTLPPQLVVHATGTVPTTGWTEPRLSAAVYIVEPVDGIQDFTFDAVAPTGIVAQHVTEISGKSELFDKPSWMKGVRVIAQENSQEKTI